MPKPKAGKSRYAAEHLNGIAGERKSEFGIELQALRLAKQEQLKKIKEDADFSAGIMPVPSEKEFRDSVIAACEDLSKLQFGTEYINSVERRNQSGLQNIVNPLSPNMGINQAPITSFTPLSSNNIYAPLSINWISLMYAYKTHGLLQTIADVPVLDALRGGLEFNSDELESNDLEDFQDMLYGNGIYRAMRDSKIWARVFGGGALVINVEGDDYARPLDINRINGAVDFYDCARWELGSEARIPASGFYDFYGLKIHKSRVLTMVGKRAPWLIRYQLAGWGMSVYENILESYNGYLRNVNAIYELMLEAKVDVYKLKGWNTQQASGLGQQAAQRRVAAANSNKSFASALVLDKEDEYEQKQVGFGGLAEMMKEHRINLGPSSHVPITKLFGISATGFNSGEDDIENYAAMVESEVREDWRMDLRKVIDISARSFFGFLPKIKFSFKPLRVLSAVDEEAIKTREHARFLSLLQANVISPAEFVDMERKEGLIPVYILAGKKSPDNFLGKKLSPEHEAQDNMVQGFGEEGNEPAPIGFVDETGNFDDKMAQDLNTGATLPQGAEDSQGADGKGPQGEKDTPPSDWADRPGPNAEVSQGYTAAAVSNISKKQGRVKSGLR